MACNISYKDGKIIKVLDDSGNPSKLYKEAVDKFGEEKGLEMYLVSKSNSFLDFFAPKTTTEFTTEVDDDRTEITLENKGNVVITETFPEYEFLEDITEKQADKLGVSEGDFISKIEHVEVKQKSKGLGRKLINEALHLINDRNAFPVYLNASPMGIQGLPLEALTKFYQSFGFKVFKKQGGNNLMLLTKEDLKLEPRPIQEPTLQEVTNYTASNNRTEAELNQNQKADLINVLISTPNFKAEDFYDEFGMFVIPQKYYSRYELMTINEAEVKQAVDALLNTEFAPNIEAAENAQKINEKNAFGKLINLNPNIVKKEAIKAIVLSDESEVPYGVESFSEEAKNYKKADVLIETLDGEIISAKNTNTEQILPLVVKENFKTDLIDSIQNLSLNTLQKSEEQTKIVLKAIENDLISQGIDAIGLSDKSIDQDLLDYLNTAKTFINSPTKENTKTFAEKSDIYFERDITPKKDIVKSEKTDRNYVKLNTNLTEEQLYEKKGLIQSELGKGIYIQTAKESLENLYNNLRTYTEKYPKGTTLEKYVQEQITKQDSIYNNAENAEAIFLYKMYFGVSGVYYRGGLKKESMFFVTPNIEYAKTYGNLQSYSLNLNNVLDLTDIEYELTTGTEVIENLESKGVKFTEEEKLAISTSNRSLTPLFAIINYSKEIANAVKRSGFGSIKQIETNSQTRQGWDFSKSETSYFILNNIKQPTKQASNFTGNYNYLTGDYVSDFYIEQLKEKQKNSPKYRNFYSNFEVNEKGINLLNTDDITMQQIEIYADDNLRQYSLISKQIPDLEVEEANENPRDLIVNNPQTIENYKKDLFRVNEDTIILKDNVETFIKVNDEIYENVEVKGNLSTFAKIKTEKSDYYQYNIKQPKTNIKLSDYNYLSTQEELFTSPKKYLNKEEKNQIKNDKFNC